MFVLLSNSVSIEGYTLIVPSVSFGNVGQLAIELLICETQALKIGHAWHPAVFPVMGTNPYEEHSSELATGIQMYCSEKDKLVFLQIRGPVIQELCFNFLNELIQDIKKYKIGCVFILAGADDREDIGIQVTAVKCIASAAFADSETFQSSSEEDMKISEEISEDIGYKVIGCGFAKPLYALCVKNKLPTAVFIKHCSEGFNIPDAVAVVERLNKWLHIIPDPSRSLNVVSSWRYMFGGIAPRNMY